MAWHIDPANTRIAFAVRKLKIITVRGRFTDFDGTIKVDEENPTCSTVDMRLTAASIASGNPRRDAHLRTSDFFDAERFPSLRFRSTRIEQCDAQHGRITGDLTIRDVTRVVVLEVDYAGEAGRPLDAGRAGFAARTVISRKDWGMGYGRLLVGDAVMISIDLVLVKRVEAEVTAEPLEALLV